MKTSSIDNFIYETTLVQPINEILIKLKNDNFRDCDIKWLNTKLENFTKFALETLGEKVILPELNHRDILFNEFVKNKFISQFETLLNYFRNI